MFYGFAIYLYFEILHGIWAETPGSILLSSGPFLFSSVDTIFSNPNQIPYFSYFYACSAVTLLYQKLKQKQCIILKSFNAFSHLLSYRKIFCLIKIHN